MKLSFSWDRILRYDTLKRCLDTVVATALLVLLLPLLLLILISIIIDSPGPAIYQQRRVGLGGKLFTIYKFRTMKSGTAILSTAEMQSQTRVPFTRIGPILRMTNLDELPQLYNVVRGDMSLVGPRPALPSQTDVNDLRAALGVDSVRPGITGLAQIMGRDEIDTATKVNYDAEYCYNMSLSVDLMILIKTVGTVLSGRGNK